MRRTVDICSDAGSKEDDIPVAFDSCHDVHIDAVTETAPVQPSS